MFRIQKRKGSLRVLKILIKKLFHNIIYTGHTGLPVDKSDPDYVFLYIFVVFMFLNWLLYSSGFNVIFFAINLICISYFISFIFCDYVQLQALV